VGTFSEQDWGDSDERHQMGRTRLRASGWARSTPRLVGQRTPGEAKYDARPANTSIRKRVWWIVWPGVMPGSVCGAYLPPGTRCHRQVLRAEPFHRQAPPCKLGATS